MSATLSVELILAVGKMQFLVHCHPGAMLISYRSLAFLAMWPSLPQASNSEPSLSRASEGSCGSSAPDNLPISRSTDLEL